ncbi:uncharacterized protein BDW43DRAFT_262899 [Aspergillus alliaceus]|uniref:uncharacterized protein n=1 Tax=Petromyces alliaceus TaxID=209559 RepID=UPI0012A577CF|nr:uncharacterized protein BDW43DRAFT_262899 [Aspergillus alliaceus]KAB8238032.1 hypothetical protein BDW43DRAFT_262899 [Aspergillus alliaceus]
MPFCPKWTPPTVDLVSVATSCARAPTKSTHNRANAHQLVIMRPKVRLPFSELVDNQRFTGIGSPFDHLNGLRCFARFFTWSRECAHPGSVCQDRAPGSALDVLRRAEVAKWPKQDFNVLLDILQLASPLTLLILSRDSTIVLYTATKQPL